MVAIKIHHPQLDCRVEELATKVCPTEKGSDRNTPIHPNNRLGETTCGMASHGQKRVARSLETSQPSQTEPLIAIRLVAEFRNDQLRNATRLMTTSQQLGNCSTTTGTKVQGPIIDVHADERVGFRASESATES